ncbi:MAG: ABC transporter substrate-binding protein [Ilumatobacteraceae bacterium]|jgi:peptide/nickel transport system substrate-binding protein|nr:ABC transporter substrate-binding protein [Ilumatobacteraceae bacterium]
MKQRGISVRSRMVKRFGAVAAVSLVGSLFVASGSQAAERPSATPKYGGEITMLIDGNIAGHCFANALPGGPLGASRSIYESLFERSSTGKYVGYLAKSATSTDNKVWTIALREGIKFSNGEEFNATVVKQNIDIGRGALVPSRTYASTGIGVNANILTVDVVDNLTVKVTLDRPDNDFLGLMYRAGRYVMRAPAQIAGTANCSTNPIGTGPFMLQSFKPDEQIVVRNPNYWRKDAAGRQLPYLDKITFLVVKEASQRAAAVRTGRGDAAFFVQGDATFTQDLAKRKSAVTGYKSTQTAWGQWMPNVNKAGSPFKFRNCRLAAAYSMDWNSYNKVRLRGTGNYSGSIVGKDHPMFTLKGAPKYDLKKARTYLQRCNTELGTAGPMRVTLYADSSTQSQNNTRFIQKSMEKAGILVNDPFIGESALLVSKIYKGGGNDFDFAQGTPAEGATPGYVFPFFVSKAFPLTSTNPIKDTLLGKGYNTVIALGNHSDDKVDELIYGAQAELNPAKAKKKWQAATAYLQDQGYAIPAVHGGFQVFVNNNAKLRGIGTLKMPSGDKAEIVETKGFEWTGVWKG